MRRAIIGLVLAALACSGGAPGVTAAVDGLFAVDVSRAEQAEVEALESARGVAWWVELGDLVVVSGRPRDVARASSRFPARELDGPRPGERLYVGHHVH